MGRDRKEFGNEEKLASCCGETEASSRTTLVCFQRNFPTDVNTFRRRRSVNDATKSVHVGRPTFVTPC